MTLFYEYALRSEDEKAGFLVDKIAKLFVAVGIPNFKPAIKKYYKSKEKYETLREELITSGEEHTGSPAD